MKRAFVAGLTVVFVLSAFALGVAQAKSEGLYKAGEEVYVCGCGEGCPCLTMSKIAGKCACGKDLVKSRIDKIEAGKAFVTIKDKQQGFLLEAKYVCGCGAACPCKTISQTAGKCACGNKLKPVEAAKN